MAIIKITFRIDFMNIIIMNFKNLNVFSIVYLIMWIDAKNRMCNRSKKGYFNSTERIIMLLCRPDIITHLFQSTTILLDGPSTFHVKCIEKPNYH